MDARVWGIVVDSFAKLLIPGITVTIPLTLISFALGLILAIVVALVRVAKVPVASQIAWFYIWVFRGTPLLVQLFVIFFGLPSVGITIPANMPYVTIMRRIILPQAFRSAFPALFNSFIALVKDTSLAANITVVEMFMTAQRIVAIYYEPLVLYIEVGLIYLLFCTLLGWLQDYCEKKLNEHF